MHPNKSYDIINDKGVSFTPAAEAFLNKSLKPYGKIAITIKRHNIRLRAGHSHPAPVLC